MAIKDLQIRQGKVDITVDVVEKSEARTFNKFGNAGRVANAKVRDESGEITLTLWNDDIDKVNVGDKVHVTNGYVSEWQGEPQLSTGKFGSMEVVGKAETSTTHSEAKSSGVKKEEKVKVATEENFDDSDSTVEEENMDDLYDEEEL